MGLFFHEAGAAARQPKQRASFRITEIEQKSLTCSHCPLDKEPLQHPKMPPTGAARPLFYFIGEAPGKNEDEIGQQFIGASGQLIRDRIPAKWEKLIRWNNVLRCRPPKNRDPAPLELACCRRLQIEDIERTKPKIIVGFGNYPLQWLLGVDRAISRWRGRLVPVKVGTHVCWFYPIIHPAALLHGMKDRKRADAYLATFEHDLARVFSLIEMGIEEPYVEDPADYLKGIECLTSYGSAGLRIIESRLDVLRNVEHALDIETNGLRPYRKDARILSLAAGTYDNVFTFAWEHPEAKWTPNERNELKTIIREYLFGKGMKWCQKAVFEQEWLNHYFGAAVLYNSKWGDTLGQAHILDERPDKALDDLTQQYFGFRIKQVSRVDVRNLENTPLSEVLPYNGMDAKYTDALRIMQGERIRQQGLEPTYELLNNATPALVLMQAKGTARNLPAIKQLDEQLTKELVNIKAHIFANGDVASYIAAGHSFSPTSNPNLVAFFRDFLGIPHPQRQRTGGAWHESSSDKEEPSSYSVDEAVLNEFRHPVAKLVLHLRTTQKNHGYVTPLFDGGKYVHGDGLVHANYGNYITVSGRLASSDPNQQNYPRREHKEIRRVYGCPPGHKFVAFDYGQLEWRIGACLSRDKTMCEELEDNKHDIHGFWTDELGGVFVPKRVKENRKKVRDSIKQYWTFANLYGNELSGLAWDLSNEFKVKITETALERYYIDFWTRYFLLKKYQDDLVAKYWLNGYVETGTGQRRHEPMTRNEIINHPFQGTAGHLVIDAQRRLSYAAWEQDRPSMQPVMNIHDDLSFYIPIKDLERDIEDIARYMVIGSFNFITVPLAVDVSVGDNWCDKEEIATFTTKDFT